MRIGISGHTGSIAPNLAFWSFCITRAQPIQQIGGKVLMSSGNITYVVDKLVQKQVLRASTETVLLMKR